MPDMTRFVNRWAAEVDSNFARFYGLKVFLGFCQRVVNSDRRLQDALEVIDALDGDCSLFARNPVCQTM